MCVGLHYRQSRQVGNLQGVCRYGNRLECCYGWQKNTKGQCEGTQDKMYKEKAL